MRSSIKNANLSIKFEAIKLQRCLIACKKGINYVVRFQYSEISWDKNSICSRQLIIKKKPDPIQHLEDDFSVASSASSSSKTLEGRWLCIWRSPCYLFLGNFEKFKKKKIGKLFSSFFSLFCWFFLDFLI